MNDSELVQHVLNGNESAFRYLVAKHQRLVMHIVGRIVQQHEDVEDVCQEVFIKVFRMMKNFRGDSRLSTWIATIAYNTSLTYLRKKNKYQEFSYDDKPELVKLEKNKEITHKIMEKEEAHRYLLKAIEKLPVQYRTVLTLFHLEEFSYKEIEEITSMPEGTIKSYLSRARKILKEHLEQVIDEEKTNIFAVYV